MAEPSWLSSQLHAHCALCYLPDQSLECVGVWPASRWFVSFTFVGVCPRGHVYRVHETPVFFFPLSPLLLVTRSGLIKGKSFA